MKPPFSVRHGRVSLRLGAVELTALASLPGLLDLGGDANGRLDYSVHADDPVAEERFRELVGDDLDVLRRTDRTAFGQVLEGGDVEPDAVEAFMRVVGEARLVLAARLGIEHDGWEADATPDDPEMALLAWLGYIQDAAVAALNTLLG